jgi:hypothetical protein
MKAAAHQHRTADQLGAPQGDQQRDEGAVAMPAQVRRPPDHRLQERDRVLCHQVEGDRSLDVRGVTVAALVGREDVKPLRQGADVVREEANVGQAAVQQHEWVARSQLVVPGTYAR